MTGFLLLLRRSLDSEPLELHADRATAEARARAWIAGYDPRAPAAGWKPTNEQRGIRSIVLGIELVPFVGGRPVDEGRCRFVPKERPVKSRRKV